MGARELLHELAGAGFRVKAEADRLVVRPWSKLTDSMREALHEAKPELLALLAREPAPVDLATVSWTAADIDRFNARRARLLRWGWSETRAEVLAERLVQRDREGDDRRACVECRHLEGAGRCAWARMGRLAGADRRLEPVPDVLQRCPSFVPIALVDSEL